MGTVEVGSRDRRVRCVGSGHLETEVAGSERDRKTFLKGPEFLLRADNERSRRRKMDSTSLGSGYLVAVRSDDDRGLGIRSSQ